MKRKRKQKRKRGRNVPEKVLVLASVASMIDQFNLPNIKLLQEMGYEVHVACNFKNGNTCDTAQVLSLSKRLRRMHVALHQWDCPRSVCSVKKCWIAYRQIRRLLRRTPFAWMHCQSPVGGALARIAAHQAGLPVIYTAHGFHFYRGAPWKNWLLYYSAEALLAYWTDVLITVNQEDYKFAKNHLKAGKIYDIPGVGVDTSWFEKQQVCSREEFCRKYQIPKEAFVLLSVGELSIRKNHLFVLDALAALRRKDVYYMICGQGPMKEKLRHRAKRLGVWEQVRMTGFQENVIEMYRNADVFVFPSMQEGMPVALIEAMAAGMPCAASNIRGNKELLADQQLFSLKQPKQLCQLLTALLDHRRLREDCKKYNQEKVRGYDLTVVQIRMKKIYRNMERDW